jgi:hypothetical protein
MKHKRALRQYGLLSLILLRQAHTRCPRSHAQSLSIRFWETNSWSKEIINLNHAAAPENCVSSLLWPQDTQTASSVAEPRNVNTPNIAGFCLEE